MSPCEGGTTVLIVDDEKDVADVYQLHLQKEYEAQAAYGGAEALEMIDETVDVVLLDRRMPDFTGDEVFREIRERGLDCRVVMVSAVHSDAELSVPADDYVEKPVAGDSLSEIVESQLAACSGSHEPE